MSFDKLHFLICSPQYCFYKKCVDCYVANLQLGNLFEFNSHCTAQVSPVCAIVGGVVGQEVVKV